jgi:hypothetical protein
MKLRYKKTGAETFSLRFNTHGLGEVLTGDDSALISELDVWIAGGWKDMSQAFKDRDLIPDNYNEWFGEPKNIEEQKRGYYF